MPPVPPDLPPLIGQSRPFLAVMEEVSRLAAVDRPVLVVGERGTGKELVAARLHYLSSRWNRPLVTLNCAALAESLLETELFGHEAGAFTGAVRRRTGRFERADGGTLFLDEIASAGAAVQEKVLRVVEYGVFERVGGSDILSCDVRLVAAANTDLPSEAEAGRFRHDLLDRLAFDVVTLPPLRARSEDIPVLAEHFARSMAVELQWPLAPAFSRSALAALMAYPWPGNVRELRNVVERAVARRPAPEPVIDSIVFDPFDSPYRPGPPPVAAATSSGATRPDATAPAVRLPTDLRHALDRLESELLAAALEQARYNQRRAAETLGLGYHQLRNRLKKHGLIRHARDGGSTDVADVDGT
ncbi:MAG: phage shock protein operon transcriptional activator [Rhodospirillales bacterium]|nr:MAG: phage shock protein operon transcriptional activator [Rhodospirillales bacterium]